MKKILIVVISFLLPIALATIALATAALLPYPAQAGISSTSYQINDYSFGNGGTATTSSTHYGLFGIAGEVNGNALTSTSYKLGPGLTYILKVNVPTAPTLSTPGNNYDRIKIVINTSGNPTDTTYAIQLSTASDFSTGILYAKSDFTAGTTLTGNDFKTASSWNNQFITNLAQNTTYYVRVAAKQGNFTQTEWGPSSNIKTNSSTLTFSVGSSTITFNHLSPSNSYTDTSQTSTLTTSTNAYNGFIIYGYDDKALTDLDDVTKTIANYVSPNSSPTSWSGIGFGYTTSDTNLQTGSGGANRFNNATEYAGFGTTGPGDPVADDLGPVLNNQISNEAFTISYRVTAATNTVAGTYKNTILYTIVPSY